MQAHRNQHAHQWTEERVALLREYWSDGLSASQIANKLGDVSRNGVIGKVHRIGLARRASPSRPAIKRTPRPSPPKRKIAHPFNPTFKEQRPEAPAPIIPVLTPLVLETGRTASVVDLNDAMCKFPIGDPREEGFAFCGRSASRGPYCADHAKLSYQSSALRAKRAASEPDELRRALKLAAAGY